MPPFKVFLMTLMISFLVFGKGTSYVYSGQSCTKPSKDTND